MKYLHDTAPVERPEAAFELRFQSLFNPARGFSFPCDAAGQVDMDALSERERNRYLYARAVVGRELSVPRMQACATEAGVGVFGSSAATAPR